MKRFINEKIAIRCKTRKEFNEFMKMCEKEGLRWRSGESPTKFNIYYDNMCCAYNFDSDMVGLGFTESSFYKIEGWKVIDFKDFIRKVEDMKFTKADLKKGDIITLRDGTKGFYMGIKTFIDSYVDSGCLHYENITNNLTNNGYSGKCLDIVKVERVKETKVVYERKEKILDKEEKKYLSAVIKPFRNKVINIEKCSCVSNEFIGIETEDDYTNLPQFKKGTMYKGMELNKEYTLEELGL